MSKKSSKSGSKNNTRQVILSEEQLMAADALTYHEFVNLDRARRSPGKIEMNPSKRCYTQRDLSLAYSPGVAAPSMEIAKDPSKVSDYTIRSNLVAVVSNGTAVLGLGNIGPLAAKPVMEGKGVLFKKFANINVFDIELNAPTVAEVVKACQMLEPTVGGINLEDIKAPDCFEIEEQLKKTLKIPVFHDDQHGTAIITAAGFINALVLQKKKAGSVKVVFSGAGSAAIACANILMKFGVRRENITICDSTGVVHDKRTDLDKYKAAFAKKTPHRKLKDAIKGADVFIGLSVAGVVTKDMVKSMAKNPIIFPMANPSPEISYEDARSARPDAIVATGRSDFPNQVNNVLGFPSIFRGALDCEASCINEEMKLAAARSLAELARQDVPEAVSKVYEGKQFVFGPEYIIPKPFDSRVLLWVAPAVAEAAIKSGVARKKLDLKAYRENLENSLDRSRQVMNIAIARAKKKMRKIVFPEGRDPRIIKAATVLLHEKLAQPILLGDRKEIEMIASTLSLSVKDILIYNPDTDEMTKEFAARLYEIRQRKGVLPKEAERLAQQRTYFGLMMTEMGIADALVSGVSKAYPETIRPILQIIPMKSEYQYAAGLYVMILKDRTMFFADTTVNILPSAEALAEIALQAAERVEFFKIQPRIAMLSFSNFGSAPHEESRRMREAAEIVRRKRPDLMIDGEMQADTAISPERLVDYSFSTLKQPANVLIFPNLASGNIAYKLLQNLGRAEVIGPILLGPSKPVHVLQQGSSVEEIIRISTIAAAEANTELSSNTPSTQPGVQGSSTKKRPTSAKRRKYSPMKVRQKASSSNR